MREIGRWSGFGILLGESEGGLMGLEFDRLVDDCWGILKGENRILFPGSTGSAPARRVLVVPCQEVGGWAWDLWDQVVVPCLDDLSEHPPFGPDGWDREDARSWVQGKLRGLMVGSPWEWMI